MSGRQSPQSEPEPKIPASVTNRQLVTLLRIRDETIEQLNMRLRTRLREIRELNDSLERCNLAYNELVEEYEQLDDALEKCKKEKAQVKKDAEYLLNEIKRKGLLAKDDIKF